MGPMELRLPNPARPPHVGALVAALLVMSDAMLVRALDPGVRATLLGAFLPQGGHGKGQGGEGGEQAAHVGLLVRRSV